MQRGRGTNRRRKNASRQTEKQAQTQKRDIWADRHNRARKRQGTIKGQEIIFGIRRRHKTRTFFFTN